MAQNRDFKGIWIPKEIWLSKDLTLQEKVFLVEIDSLDNEKGCFASNDYFAEFFGISNIRVSNIISSLIKKDYIYREGFDGRKRTLRSCFKEKFKADLNNPKCSNKENFKHSNTYNNTDETISKDIVSDSNESLTRSGLKKVSGEDLKNTPVKKEERFIQYWNTKNNLTTHRRNTKTYESAVKLFGLLSNGGFGKIYTVDPTYARTNDISDKYRTKEWGDEQIYEAIDRYDVMLSDEFGPTYKNKLPKNCPSFIFNPRTRSSLFLACAGKGKDPISNRAIIINESIVRFYQKEFFNGRKLNSVEKNELVRAVNFVIQRQRDYENEIGQYMLNSPIKDKRFFEIHVKFIRERYFDSGVFDVSKILNQNIWKKFVVWMAATHKINLSPDKKEIDKARQNFEEHQSAENIFKSEKEELEKRKKDRDEWMKNRKPNRFQAKAI